MMLSLGLSTWIRLVVWTGFGVIIYACYGYKHSCVRKAAETTGTPAARPA